MAAAVSARTIHFHFNPGDTFFIHRDPCSVIRTIEKVTNLGRWVFFTDPALEQNPCPKIYRAFYFSKIQPCTLEEAVKELTLDQSMEEVFLKWARGNEWIDILSYRTPVLRTIRAIMGYSLAFFVGIPDMILERFVSAETLDSSRTYTFLIKGGYMVADYLIKKREPLHKLVILT